MARLVVVGVNLVVEQVGPSRDELVNGVGGVFAAAATVVVTVRRVSAVIAAARGSFVTAPGSGRVVGVHLVVEQLSGDGLSGARLAYGRSWRGCRQSGKGARAAVQCLTGGKEV